ncbi:SLC13 family permease [Bacillus mobilis]|uniref:SLC13 family permease n=2 Tax=Bacillati TaxID=1783272 RepID=UPI00363FE8E7
MGAIALVVAFILSIAISGESTKELLGGFPVTLLIILVGVTYLFGLASTNGTVEWLVTAAVRAVRGRAGVIPWVLFAAAAALAAIGAASPAAVAIVAPIGIAFAVRYRTSPLMNGLMAVNGAAAGSFSPVGILGGIVVTTAKHNGLTIDPTFLFLATFGFNVLVAVATVLIFRRRGIPTADSEPDVPGSAGTSVEPTGKGGLQVSTVPATEVRTITGEQLVTMAGLVTMVLAVSVFGADAGLTALTIAVVLALLFPGSAKAASTRIAWSVVLLVCGIVTYIAVLERLGVVGTLGDSIVAIGAPLLAAFLICLIGGVVSAFASTTGILGALVPLSIPFLQSGQISATALLAALSVSASVVDASPFSTNGALLVANVPEEQRNSTYKALFMWGFALMLVAPLSSWALLVLLPW